MADSSIITRRTALKGTVASAAFMSVPAQASTDSTELSELIRVHRAAHEAYEATLAKRDAIEKANNKSLNSITAEVFPGHCYEVSLHRSDLSRHVAERHEAAREQIRKMKSLGDAARSAALADIDESERLSRKRCAEAVNDWRHHREACGLAQIEREVGRKADAEINAAIRLLAYRRKTDAEWEMRAGYVFDGNEAGPGCAIHGHLFDSEAAILALLRGSAVRKSH